MRPFGGLQPRQAFDRPRLKSPDGIAVVKKIAAKADVVMASFRPGVIARLGFGYDDIQKVNPKVIYCSVSGFGQTGPRQAPDRRRPDPGVQRHDGDEPPATERRGARA